MAVLETDLLLIERNDVLYKATAAQVAGLGGAGSVLKGTAVITLPNGAGVLQWEEEISAVGVTGSATVFVGLASHSDDDENDALMLDLVAVTGQPGTDVIGIEIAFSGPASGPIKLNWSAV